MNIGSNSKKSLTNWKIIKKKKDRGIKNLWSFLIFCFVVLIYSDIIKSTNTKEEMSMKKKLLIAFCTFAILGVSTPTYAGGVTGVEVQKDDSEKYGVISDFDYDIEGNSVKLHGYDGKCKILEILMLNQLFFKKELLKYMMLFLIPVMFKKYFFLKV